jgi:hypothetical protein
MTTVGFEFEYHGEDLKDAAFSNIVQLNTEVNNVMAQIKEKGLPTVMKENNIRYDLYI